MSGVLRNWPLSAESADLLSFARSAHRLTEPLDARPLIQDPTKPPAGRPPGPHPTGGLGGRPPVDEP
ncbi:hypothetical protein PG995_006486 [Apiospora arundinis]